MPVADEEKVKHSRTLVESEEAFLVAVMIFGADDVAEFISQGIAIDVANGGDARTWKRKVKAMEAMVTNTGELVI